MIKTTPLNLKVNSHYHALTLAAALLSVAMLAAFSGCSTATPNASSNTSTTSASTSTSASASTSSSASSSSSSSLASATTSSIPSTVKAGDTVTFGTYEQDNNTSNGQEAIEWQVLDVQDGKALLISKYGLDCQPYNTKSTDVTWETCTLRTWLNSTFYTTAFSADEQSKIASTTLTNEDNSEYNTKGGNATTDKVFCLSLSEVNKYYSTDSSRICISTAYAVAQGAVKSSGANGCFWWLRSPGFIQYYAAEVLRDGFLYSNGSHVDDSIRAVRPALWVNL